MEQGDIIYYLVRSKFQWAVCVALTTHDASYLEILGGFEGLHGVMTDIAVTYYGGSNLFHCQYNVKFVVCDGKITPFLRKNRHLNSIYY